MKTEEIFSSIVCMVIALLAIALLLNIIFININ